MTKYDRREVLKLLCLPPIDPKMARLEKQYLDTFNSLSGIEDFVENCGGVDDAIEVLAVCQTNK